MSSSPSRGGRPSEQPTPVTRTLHVRLTEAEHDRLNQLAGRLGVPVSRLVRRAVREMVNGGPDLFDDGVDALSEVARGLAAAARQLDLTAKGAEGVPADRLHEVRAQVEAARSIFGGLVVASRERWVVAKAAVGAPRRAPMKP